VGVLLGLGSMERISRLEQCEEMFHGATGGDPEASCLWIFTNSVSIKQADWYAVSGN
jgi:hypothetical protein